VTKYTGFIQVGNSKTSGIVQVDFLPIRTFPFDICGIEYLSINNNRNAMSRSKKDSSLTNNPNPLPDEVPGTDSDSEFEIQKINQNRDIITNIIEKMIDKINQAPENNSKS
jgi:hypothetical protein